MRVLLCIAAFLASISADPDPWYTRRGYYSGHRHGLTRNYAQGLYGLGYGYGGLGYGGLGIGGLGSGVGYVANSGGALHVVGRKKRSDGQEDEESVSGPNADPDSWYRRYGYLGYPHGGYGGYLGYGGYGGYGGYRGYLGGYRRYLGYGRKKRSADPVAVAEPTPDATADSNPDAYYGWGGYWPRSYGYGYGHGHGYYRGYGGYYRGYQGYGGYGGYGYYG